MSGPQALIGRQRDQLLADAAHLKTQLVLTCKAQGRWETHKSRLLDMVPARRALVVAHPYDDQDGTLEFARGEQVGVAFRHHSRKCLFATILIGKRQPRQHRTRAPGSRALLLSWPEQIEQLQRRVYKRVAIPPGAPIAVRFWRGGLIPHNQTPVADGEAVPGRLLDLSVGGMRVEIAQADDPHLHANDVVAAEFRPEPDQPSLVLEACFRHAQPCDGDRLSLGFQFVGLELSAEDPSPLTRLAQTVGHLHRIQCSA